MHLENFIKQTGERPLLLGKKEMCLLFGKKLINLIEVNCSRVKYTTGQDHISYTDQCLKNDSSSDVLFRDLLRFQSSENERSFRIKRQDFAAPLLFEPPKNALSADRKLLDIRFFTGLKGQSSSFHFDWKQGANFLYNINGQKRVYLSAPEQSRQFKGYSNFSKANCPTDKAFDLGPDEALYIPPFWWHKAEYLTDASSASLRTLWGQKTISFLKFYYPSWKVIQAIALQKELKSFRWPRVVDRLRYFEKVENYLNSEIGYISPELDQEDLLYNQWCLKFILFKSKRLQFDRIAKKLALSGHP